MKLLSFNAIKINFFKEKWFLWVSEISKKIKIHRKHYKQTLKNKKINKLKTKHKYISECLKNSKQIELPVQKRKLK